MSPLVRTILILSLVAETWCLFSGGVFDLNFFKCMWRKDYDCPHEDIRFFLYTPTARKGRLIDITRPKSVFRAGFKAHRETAIIIHGFNGTQTSRHIMFLKDAYLSRKFNVFAVDWERISAYPCYLSSLSNTKLVAQCTAQLYSFITFTGSRSKQITCVGHSLGAHICGMMTNHLTKRQHKIIGLDPAKPLIENHASSRFRLTKDDAKVVQVVHTNAGFLGQSSFSGTIDFCINGGQSQPYCSGDQIKQARCSHFLSVCYLANAIFAKTQTTMAFPVSQRVRQEQPDTVHSDAIFQPEPGPNEILPDWAGHARGRHRWLLYSHGASNELSFQLVMKETKRVTSM